MPIFYGTSSDDSIIGTSGADVMEDFWGDDVIDGGDGDDSIFDGGGTSILRGGAGNDWIRFGSGLSRQFEYRVMDSAQIEAGSGDDRVSIASGMGYNLTVDLGSGRDLLWLNARSGYDDHVAVTTGAGSDRIGLNFAYGDMLRFRITFPSVVVTDFTAGAGGDVLDLGYMLKGLLAFETVAANPFSSGHLRLVQDGADTVVRVDVDGNGSGSSATYLRDVVRLKDVSAATLVAENFAGYAPNGAALARTIRIGTEGGEWLTADVGGSDLAGLSGADVLAGGLGADVLDGGIGDDNLFGGDGDDLLRGGDGADFIADELGNDVLEGGAGNDIIALFRPGLPFYLPPLHQTIGINAGDGDDLVAFAIGLSESSSGVTRITVALSIDLGAGNDRLVLPHLVQGTEVRLGSGQDRVVLGEDYFDSEYQYDYAPMTNPLRILDFEAGAAGDVIELDRLAWVPGWNFTDNPFALGNLRLQQEGADTLILSDYDGNGSGTEILAIARLVNVNAASLTAFNFGGYDPAGTPSSWLVATGTGGSDHIYGSYGADTIDGGAGNDLIEDRKGGADRIFGGDGNDRIIVRPTIINGPADILIEAGAGEDEVELAGSGHLDVDLGGGDDRIRLFSLGIDSLTLGAGRDTVVLDVGVFGQSIDPIVIEDFVAGADGDRLDWGLFPEFDLIYLAPIFDPLLDPFRDPTVPIFDYNPFFTGDARLVQSGVDTLLQIYGGNAGRGLGAPLTLVVFRNTNASAFTAENVGYATFIATADGSSANDSLSGTAGLDVIHGNGGDDIVNGLAGDDVIRGHDGADQLTGGDGRDRLEGGTGDDILIGGNDDDYLNGAWGRDVIDGGAGNDTISDLFGRDEIRGGDGDDLISVWGFDDFAAGGSTAYGSVVAGAGNDRVYAGAGGSAYSVDLGAGDDYLLLGSPIGSLVLGTGRDTLAFWGGAYSELTLTDFTPGNAGDIFDLREYLKQQLGRGTAWPLIEAGANPFQLGYVGLRQVGANVELIFLPGSANQQYKPVRFLNTTLDQFTAANFAGFDPDGVPDATTTLVQGALTIAAGQRLETVDLPPYGQFGEWNAHYVVSEFATQPVAFVNNGEIVSRLTRVPLGDLAGFLVESYVGGSFVNGAGAKFIVRSEWIDESGVLDQGWTYGFRGAGGTLSFRNDGHFEVRAASGTVSGIMSGYDVLTGQPIVNNGLFVAVAPEDVYAFDLGSSGPFSNTGSIQAEAGQVAVGVYFGGGASPNTTGLFNNSGTIDVYGGEAAYGVYFLATSTDQINNSGEIIARVGPGSPYASVGILMGDFLPRDGGVITHVNSGLIEADIAFYVWDFGSSDNIPDRLINSGTINGAILLSRGDDRVVNSGTISGRTMLESGDDRYEGGEGRHFGSVEGGNGDDVLIGGVSGEDLFGDNGDDVIHGAGGDDYIEGGAGFDRLDGGAGFDILSYFGSYLPVVVDLAAGTASDGMSTDWVAGFEFAIGSRGADSISGGNPGETLVGLRGNDRLDGRGGDDILHGGVGTDVMIGGAGNDRFLFERNDGNDQIEDFAVGDRIEIYGYATAQSVVQAGADVLVTLSATDSVLVRNASLAAVNAALSCFAVALGLDVPAPPDQPIFADGDLVIGVGAEFALDDPQRIVIPLNVLNMTALVRGDPAGASVRHAFNAGTLSLTAGTGEPVVGVVGMSGLVNLATGTLQVVSQASAAVGTFGTALWNFGRIEVRSLAGHAVAAQDVGPSIFGGQFLNSGTILVDAAGIGVGLGQEPTTTVTTDRVFNTGLIDVHGGEASFGIEYRANVNPMSPPAVIVNSGTIKVTDETAALDSAGILFELSGAVRVWNSGTIEADYAFRRTTYFSGLPPPSSLEVYNSGQLKGHFEGFGGLFAIDTRLINTGGIVGNVTLANGNDLYDGRLGTLTGTLSGDGGDDVLLAGAGDQQISGGLGNDLLSGGAGTDVLTGGAGADVFRFESGFGADTITDFGAGDRIEVAGYAAWSSIAQQGADVVVTFGSNRLILANQNLANVTADRFTFNAAAIAANVIPVAPIATAAPTTPTPVAPAMPLTHLGSAAVETLNGTAGADIVYAYGGNDQLFLHHGGKDWADGGGGNDGFYFGSALDGSDTVDGNSGTDSLAIQGNYANLVLTGVTGIEVLYVAPGSDTRFGDTAGNSYDYVVRTVDANVAAGSGLTVIGGELRAGEDLAFDGSAETNGTFRIFAGRGNDTLTGGARNDGFFFGADGNLTGADRLQGGDGTDSIALRGNYVGARAVSFQEFSFTGIEVLTFLSGHTNEFGGFIDANGFDYDVTLPSLVQSQVFRLDLIATNLRANESLRVDGSAVTLSVLRILSGAGDDALRGGAERDLVYGGFGADSIDGGAGDDTYIYRAAGESTAAARDTIAFVAGDKIDLAVIDANGATTGVNDAFAFIGSAAFSNVAGQLRAIQSGGQWLVEGDVSGDGVADLVIAVTTAAPLTVADFVL